MPDNVTKKKELVPGDRLIISIDVSSEQQLISLCYSIDNKVTTLKLGLELIYSCGLKIIDTAKSFGYKVMLDAKLMDIPNTVGRAISAITGLGVDKVTIHTLGGARMIMDAKEKAAAQALKLNIFPPLIFGVTILTSLDNNDLEAMSFKGDYLNAVLCLAGQAIENGIDGIICSPNEVIRIRENFGDSFYIATPGIRLEDDAAGDQKRISTPYAAIKNGADFIIAGRSVTAKEDTGKTIKTILEEIERALI
ncbi:MAG TPA: orotidine-5'-phosphate decarboxylase [Candidatus Humimicrobiaceae bacterium]